MKRAFETRQIVGHSKRTWPTDSSPASKKTQLLGTYTPNCQNLSRVASLSQQASHKTNRAQGVARFEQTSSLLSNLAPPGQHQSYNLLILKC